MADVAKGYGVGDTVWIAYPHPSKNFFTAQSRIVKSVDVISGTNDANVKFTNGNDVFDPAATPTVFDTQVLASTAIIDDVIAKIDATVILEGLSNSLASTAAQPALSLGRVDT